MSIEPITRKERILAGEDVKPLRRDEYFIKNATPGGGGGSSLPSYTSSDIGKVLTVGEAEPVETVVIPEQDITVELFELEPLTDSQYGAWLTGVTASPSDFTDGQVATMRVSREGYPDVTLECAWKSEDGAFYANGGYTIGYFDGKWFYLGTQAQLGVSFNISVVSSVSSAEPKWEANTLVVEISEHDGELVANYTAEQIISAAEKGLRVIVNSPASEGYNILSLTKYAPNGSCEFASVIPIFAQNALTGVSGFSLLIGADGSVSFVTDEVSFS